MVSPTDLNQELYVAFLLVTEIVSSLGLTCLRLLVKKSNKGRVGSYTHVISKTGMVNSGGFIGRLRLCWCSSPTNPR